MTLLLVLLASIGWVAACDAAVDTLERRLDAHPEDLRDLLHCTRGYEARPLHDEFDCMEARRI